MESISTNLLDSCISNYDVILTEKAEPAQNYFGKLEFNFGQLQYTCAGGRHCDDCIKGEIHLILPKGIYKIPNPESIDKVYQYLVKWSDEHGVEFRSRRHRNEQILLSINIIGSTFGGDVAASPLLMAASVVTLIFFIIDDLNEDTDFLTLDLATAGGIHSFRKNIEDILSGCYKSVEELPAVKFPMLEPFPLLTFLVYQLLILHHRGFGAFELPDPDQDSKNLQEAEEKMRTCEKSCREFQKEFISAMSLMFNPKFIENCSEELFFRIRGLDVGGTVLIEWIFAHMHFKIPDKIRSHLLFKLLVQSGAEACAIIQDVFSLKKELNEPNCANLILRKVKQGMTLPNAMDVVLNLFKNKLMDIKVCSEKLLEDYPECEDLEAYIEMGKYSTDGQSLMYRLPGCMSRYGELQCNVTYFEDI